MIGQENNLDIIRKWRLNKSIPRFIIIEGDKGSGKLSLAKVISKILGSGVICDKSVDSVRRTIRMSYTITEPVVYIFRNSDDMSLAAKNALLKAVEEPPNRAYFIMTVTSLDNVLDTVRSRAAVLKMEPYTLEQLKQYDAAPLVLKYSTNIGQLIELTEDKVTEAESVVLACVHALNSRKGGQILKATVNLKSKQLEEDKVDCALFMAIFTRNLHKVKNITNNNCPEVIDNIEVCKNELRRGVINKKTSIECMLLRLTEVFKNDTEVSKNMG